MIVSVVRQRYERQIATIKSHFLHYQDILLYDTESLRKAGSVLSSQRSSESDGKMVTYFKRQRSANPHQVIWLLEQRSQTPIRSSKIKCNLNLRDVGIMTTFFFKFWNRCHKEITRILNLKFSAQGNYQ